MISAIEAALWGLMWRLTFWFLLTVLRVFWLPILIVAAIYLVVIPALLALAHFALQLLQPAAVLAVAMFVLWMWRR